MAANQRQAGTRSLTAKAPEAPGPGEPSPWRRAKVGGIVFGVVVTFGILLTLFGGSGSNDEDAGGAAPAGTAPTSQAGGRGPGAKASSVRNGIPVGYPRTREGAVAAAVNYQTARSSPGYFSDQALRHQVLSTVMTSAALPGQQSQDDQAAKGLLAALGVSAKTAPSMVMRASPLGTKVTAFSSETATVQVWMSELVGVPAEKSPMPVSGTWSTYTVILQWQEGDWKVATISQSDGPTPLVAADSEPSSTGEMRQANEGFDAPRYAG
ncbi:hypothetical protein ACFU5O_28080 [Streptomyces sp. NPDC057445]|uniref:hypothetical protein n=1 Tax=Streptomyces sp. NPDC057445 TaxID=3346136 RepID=UPI0036A139B8